MLWKWLNKWASNDWFSRNKQPVLVPERTYSEKEYKELLNTNACLNVQIGDLRAEVTRISLICEGITTERDKLKTVVREQTEADLLINALRGLGIVPKKESYSPFLEQQRLFAQQQMAAQMNMRLYSPLDNMGISGLGIIR